MTRRSVSILLLASMLGAAVFAHGGFEHVTGFVKAITASSLTITTTRNETIDVLLTEKTEFLSNKTKAARSALKIGDRVVVHAMKNKDGKLEAHEVAFSSVTAP